MAVMLRKQNRASLYQQNRHLACSATKPAGSAYRYKLLIKHILVDPYGWIINIPTAQSGICR